MKYETTQKLIHTGVVLLILAACVGMYMWYTTSARLDKLEATQVDLRCPKCPTEVNCRLVMPPIKGELIYRDKK